MSLYGQRDSERAYCSGCILATCTRNPLPCTHFPQWRHWLLLNTRDFLFGFFGQWCLQCSTTPRAVKRLPQNLHLVSFGDGAFISCPQTLDRHNSSAQTNKPHAVYVVVQGRRTRHRAVALPRAVGFAERKNFAR